MAEILSEWPSISRTRTSKYPWEGWTNGEIWQVRKDDDFTSDVKTFVQGLYAYAKRHGMKVEVRTDAEKEIAAFRFVAGAQVVQNDQPAEQAPVDEQASAA